MAFLLSVFLFNRSAQEFYDFVLLFFFAIIDYTQMKLKMKTKLFIMAALCATAFNVNAQTEKGKMLLGGAAQFQTNTTDMPQAYKNTQTNLVIQPQFGFFVADNFSVAASLTYYRTKYQNNQYSTAVQSDYEQKRESYGFAPLYVIM